MVPASFDASRLDCLPLVARPSSSALSRLLIARLSDIRSLPGEQGASDGTGRDCQDSFLVLRHAFERKWKLEWMARVSWLPGSLCPGQLYGADFLKRGLAGYSGLILGGDQDPPQFDDHVQVGGVSLGGVPGCAVAAARRTRCGVLAGQSCRPAGSRMWRRWGGEARPERVQPAHQRPR